jgi:hypothetical protein
MIPLPNLPDNSHKILILVGIASIFASFYLHNTYEQKIDLLIEKNSTFIDSANVLSLEIERRKEELLDKDSVLSLKYNRKRLISGDSSNLVFARVIVGDSTSLVYTEEVKTYWESYKDALNRENILYKKIESTNTRIESENDSFFMFFSIYFMIAGALIFFGGIILLERRESQNNILSLRQNAHLPFVHLNCQSCGQRFSAIVKYGTNYENTSNYSFCTECYNEGKFTEPDISFEEMISKVERGILHLSKRRKKRILKSLQNLDRWKRDRY